MRLLISSAPSYLIADGLLLEISCPRDELGTSGCMYPCTLGPHVHPVHPSVQKTSPPRAAETPKKMNITYNTTRLWVQVFLQDLTVWPPQTIFLRPRASPGHAPGFSRLCLGKRTTPVRLGAFTRAPLVLTYTPYIPPYRKHSPLGQPKLPKICVIHNTPKPDFGFDGETSSAVPRDGSPMTDRWTAEWLLPAPGMSGSLAARTLSLLYYM